MSIFDTIIFDEFTLLEGKQADAYKRIKASEKYYKDKDDKERRERRYGGLENDNHNKFVGNKMNKQWHRDRDKAEVEGRDKDVGNIERKIQRTYCDDEQRTSASSYVANKAVKKGRSKGKNYDYNEIHDAVNRDRRRHPDKWKSESEYDRLKLKRESAFEDIEMI